MSNLFSHWRDGVSPRLGGRKPHLNAVSRVEDLEARVVLSRESGFLAPDAAALIAVEPQAETPPVDTAARSAIFDVPAGARKRLVVDIKQWQGTWNVTTDIPFLGNGTLQIRQLSAKKFEATTTGMSGNQFYALKSTDDAQLHFKIKGTDLAGKPKLVGFLVDLNTSTLKTFQGIAKVAGGNGPHSISATLQDGTAPMTADVQPAFFNPDTTAKPGRYPFKLIVANFGQAAIPTDGLKVDITFTGDFTTSSIDIPDSTGFSSLVASQSVAGQLVVTGIVNAMVGRRSAGVALIAFLDVTSSFTVIVTVSDNNGASAPMIPTVSTPVLNVTVE